MTEPETKRGEKRGQRLLLASGRKRKAALKRQLDDYIRKHLRAMAHAAIEE